MLVQSVHFVDTCKTAAFLWEPARGITHANMAAWAWTEDLIQREALMLGARDAALSCRAETISAADGVFLLVPLLGADERVDFVLGIQGRSLEDVPLVLHHVHENLRHFSQVVHLLPQIVLTARPDGAFDYASRRWYQVTGAPVAVIDIAESVARVLGARKDAFMRAWKAGVENSEAFAFEFRLRTAAQGERWFELRAAPTYTGGRLRKWIITLDDVHDRVAALEHTARSRRRSQALAHIGAMGLDADIRDEQFLRAAIASTAATLGGHCLVALTVGSDRLVLCEPTDERMTNAVLRDAFQITGPTVTTEQWPSEDPRHVLHVPLSLTDPPNDRLVVIGAERAAPFDDLEVAFAAEVAWRIETVLRNRLAFRRETQIARVLQKAMLPLALPRSAAIAFDVAYQPAENDALIGGDWYDAFELRDGRLAFSLGDVAGHGLEAAVIMGHVRELLRATAMQGASPGDALAETNRVIMAAGYELITAFIGYIDPVTLNLRYASAGHAPPYIVGASSALRTLELGDVILGAVAEAHYVTHTTALADDEALVLYTDGLVEHSREPLQGERMLEMTLREWADAGFAYGAEELVKRALGGAHSNDDVAMLVVHSKRHAQSDPAGRRSETGATSRSQGTIMYAR